MYCLECSPAEARATAVGEETVVGLVQPVPPAARPHVQLRGSLYRF